ncbi:ankyrin repeat protein [Paraburkholderia fungorum]|jgi:ankyrin repeat protein|uniref:ankyrin repeat domain-containing protein n=1 Tax=Paraburkholderia fungorum TaxID=134537 RepID=UPI000D049A3A|nr:ankyrin repeat domain-containing protein [Paraburkholderia fungorum]PRZ56447.1 ankyrin repeat protein [Paraburkholderia fungorum]
MINDEWVRFLAAIRGGHADEVSNILAKQPELATIRRPGYDDPLTVAAKWNRVGCLRALLPHFARDPLAALNAFFGAAEFGSLDCLLALSIKTHSHRRNREGSTALMLAAIKGHAECLRALLPHSDALASDDGGWTSLMMASFAQHPACVEALLPHSDSRAVNAGGESAFSLALGRADSRPALRLDACIDLLAPFADPSLASTALARLGAARMPRFAALREAEELAVSAGLKPISRTGRASTRWTRDNTAAQASRKASLRM